MMVMITVGATGGQCLRDPWVAGDCEITATLEATVTRSPSPMYWGGGQGEGLKIYSSSALTSPRTRSSSSRWYRSVSSLLLSSSIVRQSAQAACPRTSALAS